MMLNVPKQTGRHTERPATSPARAALNDTISDALDSGPLGSAKQMHRVASCLAHVAQRLFPWPHLAKAF
jgi:hypothetical protein